MENVPRIAQKGSLRAVEHSLSRDALLSDMQTVRSLSHQQCLRPATCSQDRLLLNQGVTE